MREENQNYTSIVGIVVIKYDKKSDPDNISSLN